MTTTTRAWPAASGPASSPAPPTTTRAASRPTRRPARSSGFALVWTLFLTTPLMIGIQMLSARIGCVTRNGLATNIGQHLPALADGVADRPARRRQHDQHRRRRRGDGRSGQAAGRRAAADLRARHRRGLHRHADLLLVRADGARPEVADARALRLCRGGARGRRALAARHASNRCSPGRSCRPARRPRNTRRWSSPSSARRSAPTCSSGRRRRKSRTAGAGPKATSPAPSPGLRAQAPAPHQARHGGRHGLLEPGRAVHRRRHRGDAEPARHHQHPDRRRRRPRRCGRWRASSRS